MFIIVIIFLDCHHFEKPFKVQLCHKSFHLLWIVVKGEQMAENSLSIGIFKVDGTVSLSFSYYAKQQLHHHTSLVSGVKRQSLGFEPGAPGGQTVDKPVPA